MLQVERHHVPSRELQDLELKDLNAHNKCKNVNFVSCAQVSAVACWAADFR